MVEHLIVKFDPGDIREVLLDGDDVGPTESVLLVDADRYEITLSGAQNYAPASQDVLVSGTTSASPLVVAFSKVAAGV